MVCWFLAGPVVSAATDSGPTINWRGWSEETFALAAREDRLIFIDVGIEGCTACRRMDEVTFRDQAVIELLNRHFVAIQVDAEARPDVGDRYSDWAWPALVFLKPDATQVLALRGNRVPVNFIAIINDLLADQADGQLDADTSAPLAAPESTLTGSLDQARLQIRRQIDGQLNESSGSWRRNGLSPTSSLRHEHLMFRAHLYENKELYDIGIRSAESFLELLDPVWGGVYQGYFVVENADTDGSGASHRVIGEKRIAAQAGALEVFATAYQLTGERRFARAIEMVDRYLQEWMVSENGTYYTSQEDVPVGLPSRVSEQQYWGFRLEHDRRKFGIPPIDHAIYTDKNALIVRGYLRAFEATGEPNYLAVARRCAAAILAERLTAQGWVRQTGSSRRIVEDARMRPPESTEAPTLQAQAEMGRALLALYMATGEERWLEAGERIATAMISALHDPNLGGFYALPAGDHVMLPRRKPLESNAQAARFLYPLGVITRQERFVRLPEETIRSVALQQVITREGKVTARTGLMLELMAAAYVEFTVVGDREDPRARALFDASLATYHPRKVLQIEPPGRYRKREAPALYICNPDYCTLPIEDPEEIGMHLADFHRPARTPYPG